MEADRVREDVACHIVKTTILQRGSKSDKDKYSFVVVKYPQKATADAALNVVLGLTKVKVIKLRDAVTITKTEKGKLKLHQTKDDTAKKGFVKGGGTDVLFAQLFAPVGWVAAGVALGTAFALFDRGIKDKLLKELGEKMTPEQSALAVLVEEADWETLRQRMAEHNFHGEIIVQELIADHLAAVEKLVDTPPTTEEVPEELVVEALAETPVAEAPAPEAVELVAETPVVEVPAAEVPPADQAEKAS